MVPGWCLRGRVLSDTGGQWLRVTSGAPPPPHPRAARPRPAPPRLTAGMQLSLFLSWVSILPRPRHGPQPRDHWPMGCERTEAGCCVCLTLALASRTPRPASLDAGALVAAISFIVSCSLALLGQISPGFGNPLINSMISMKSSFLPKNVWKIGTANFNQKCA